VPAADEKTIRIAEAAAGRAGEGALVAFADAWRAYAHAHPGRTSRRRAWVDERRGDATRRSLIREQQTGGL
jgi:hypothetical protein